MKPDQFEESRRLTSLYSEMGEIEIRELAAGIDDLTEVAKQVLRDELKKRGVSGDASALNNARDREWEHAEDSPDQMAAEGEDDGRAEFTWKTALCECNTNEEAMALVLALRKAGIDGWVDRQRFVNGPTVLVAADQLAQAREIAAQPIPQDIIDEMNEPPEEFIPPTCPACGAEDPTLESTDPSNTWVCESCDNTWTEASPA